MCGGFTTPKERQKMTDFTQKSYHAYFGVKLEGQDKSWTPHRVCASCVSIPSLWTKVKNYFFFGGGSYSMERAKKSF